MYQDGELIGQNMFMRTAITSDDGRSIPIMTMDPICIKNEYKRKGYGKGVCCMKFQWWWSDNMMIDI